MASPRARCAQVLQKGVAEGDVPGAGPSSGEEGGLPADLGLGSSQEREQMSTSELRRKLDAVGRFTQAFNHQLRKFPEEEDPEDRLQEAAADSDFVEELQGLTSGSSLKRRRPLEDTRDFSTRDVSSHLVRQAQQRSAEKGHRGGESRERKGSGEEPPQLLRLLNQAARGAGGSGGGRDPSDHRGERSKSMKKKKKNKMEPTNPNANTYVNPLCIERDTAG